MTSEDAETEALIQLAKNTPSKFRIMTIKDNDTGITIKVDQSMDATFSNQSNNTESMMRKMYALYSNCKGKTYDGCFDGLYKVSIGGLEVDFGDIEGRKAYNWLLRYIISLLRVMKNNGIITESVGSRNG